MDKSNIPITLLLLFLLSIGVSSQSLRYLQKSEDSELIVVDDEACLHDADCHRNVTVCAFEGCCSYKECFDDGECVVSMPRCILPEEPIVVDNETCFNDPTCRRNVTVCVFEGCCSFKECPENGDECMVAMAMCILPEEPVVEVDNETCFNDPNCHRNVTVCSFEGCCSYKTCPADSYECFIAMPMCIAPEEPVLEVDNETCFNDPTCHRNVTVCAFEGCCSFKSCPENGNECMIAMPMCIAPEEPVSEVDDEACFNDPNCHRNITLCSSEGCCSYKTCPADENECFIAITMCIAPEEPVLEVDNETCFNDPTCRRNVTVCAFEGCCSFKSCPENGDECMIAMPMCIAPEEPVVEVDDETCFNDPNCHRNITLCSSEGCCSYKTCPADSDECFIAMPMCIAPEPPVLEVPVIEEEVDDETCFNDPNCRRNVTLCYFEGCCSFKECPENGGECMIAMPMCIAPEVAVEEVEAPKNPPKVQKPKLRKCRKGSQISKKSLNPQE